MQSVSRMRPHRTVALNRLRRSESVTPKDHRNSHVTFQMTFIVNSELTIFLLHKVSFAQALILWHNVKYEWTIRDQAKAASSASPPRLPGGLEVDGPPCHLATIRVRLSQAGLARASHVGRVPPPILLRYQSISCRGLEDTPALSRLAHAA
jgi:hypothetical protein